MMTALVREESWRIDELETLQSEIGPSPQRKETKMSWAIMKAPFSIPELFAFSLASKVIAITAFALLSMLGLRRGQASVRHLVLAGAFVVLLGMPLASLIPPMIELVPFPSSTSNATFVTSGPGISGKADSRDHSFTETRSSEHWSSHIAILWMLGTAVSLLPIFVGSWEVERIRRFGLPWLRGSELARDLAPAKPLKQVPVVLVHEAVRRPIAAGIFRPTFVFPPEAKEWNEAAVRRAMVHKLEHFRRRDSLVNGFARAVCALYWFNPLVWMCWRRLVLEAERACDVRPLRGADAAEDANKLVTLAGRIRVSALPAIVAMASRSDLATRATAILDHRQRGRAGRGCALITFTVGVLLLATLAHLRIVIATPMRTAQAVSFEVASVKRDTSVGRGQNIVPQAGGRFVATGATLSQLIGFAYAIQGFQIVGGPGWVSSDRWEIQAKAQDGSIPTSTAPRDRTKPGPIALRLQSLLAERFGLKAHKAIRELPVYELSIAAAGPKIKLSEDQTPVNPLQQAGAPNQDGRMRRGTLGSTLGGGHIEGAAVPLSDIVGLVSIILDRTIIDKTGLTGLYDIDLNWTPDPAQNVGLQGPLPAGIQRPPVDPAGPSIFTALQDQLGLRLQSARGPVEVLIIDAADKPMEN